MQRMTIASSSSGVRNCPIRSTILDGLILTIYTNRKKIVVNRNNINGDALVNGSRLISNATVAARGIPKKVQ